MSSTNKNITLITGANGGIGFALAQLLLAEADNVVLLGARSVEKGEKAVQDLKALNLPGTVDLVHIDVSSDESVEKAARDVAGKYDHLDALVNNAAISGDYEDNGSHAPSTGSLSSNLMTAFKTNTIGPAITVAAFAELMKKSTKTPRIINVTSGAGSIGMRLDFSHPHQQMQLLPYRTSKAALHMITACQAFEYNPLGWKCFSFCPGHTVSNLGPFNKAEMGAKPTAEGARPMLAILRGERDEENAGFLNATESGKWPW